MRVVVDRGEPFFYPGGDIGCLLIHGFTGAPEEMRWMGKYLAEQGFTVLGVRLFAHATQVADMNRARWEDWLANAEDGYHMLRGLGSQVVVIGMSMGGALTLLLAREFEPAGILVMATPIRIPDNRVERIRPLLPLISKVMPTIRLPGGSDWADKEAEKLQLHYHEIAVRSAAELHDLLGEMRRSLGRVRAPALLLYAKGDLGTPPNAAHFILEQLGSSDKQILWLENGGHNIARDAGREQAFEAAAEFIRRIAA